MLNIVTLLCWCWIICISINIFEFYSKTCLNSFEIICSLYLTLSFFMLYFLVKHWRLWLSWIPRLVYLIQEDHIVLHHGLLFLHCCLETLSSQHSGSRLRFTSLISRPSGSSALWCLLPNVLRQCFMVFCCCFYFVCFIQSEVWIQFFCLYFYIWTR